MKRCPQCEFIYEDDQSLCDMDGVLLVFDSRTLPNHALTTVPAKTPQKRNRVVPAFATVILAVVLALVYYVSTHRRAVQTTYTPPTPAASTSEAAPVVVATPEVPAAVEAEPQPKPAVEESKPTTTKPAATAPAPVKKPTAKTAATTQETKTEPKKDDSKVGSIIKKTGRILKKPFKF